MEPLELMMKFLVGALVWEAFRIFMQQRYWQIKRRLKYLILGKTWDLSYYG